MLSRSLPTPLSCCMSKLPILCHGSIAHPPVGSFSSYSFEPFLQLKISLFPLSFQRPHLHSYKALIFFPGQLMVIGVCVLPLCALKGPEPKAAPCTGCQGFLTLQAKQARIWSPNFAPLYTTPSQDNSLLIENDHHSVISHSLHPHELQPTRLLCLWGFSRQEYWSGLPFYSPGDLPDSETKPGSTALETNSLSSKSPGKPFSAKPACYKKIIKFFFQGIIHSIKTPITFRLIYRKSPLQRSTSKGLIKAIKKNGIIYSAYF